MGKNYRWGILGAGRIAEKFCTAIDFVEGSSVYAVASRDEGNANAFAARHQATRIYTDYEALMKDPDVDIIYIATPHAFHYEQTMACLTYGKPVLCEKPLSLTFRQSCEMVEMAQSQKLFLMEGMWTACMPFVEKIFSLISKDVIGSPTYVAADFGFATVPDASSRLYDKKLGGGSLMDVGIYPLFLATLILGEPVQLKAVAGISETGVDEYMNMVLEYPLGGTAQVLSSISFKTPIEAIIVGTKGTIKIANPWFKATDISLYLENEAPQHFNFPHQSNGFEHEILEVVRCLDAGLLESSKMPHQLTLTVSRLMEDALQQVGVQYAGK